MTASKLARRVHPIAGAVALLTMVAFWTSTVAVELVGSTAAIAAVKHAIMWGLLILVPAIAATGGTGFVRAGRSRNARILAKRRRMPAIGAIGVLVLVPCVLYLGTTTSASGLGTYFHEVQAVELMAGAVNITLMSLNVRDGLRVTRRLGARRVNV
jgi:hypothetical protein